MFRQALVLAAWLAASVDAAASDKPSFGPPPAWVAPAPALAPAPGAPGGAALDLRLMDVQMNFGPEGDGAYVHRILRINAASGLSAANVAVAWNPETQDITLHRLVLIRDGKSFDLLADRSKLVVLRRETNLEAASLDGTLTATLQPEDVRIGDQIDVAMTILDHDPVLATHRENVSDVTGYPTIGQLRIRAVWPKGRAMRWAAGPGLPAPQVRSTPDGGQELVIGRAAFDPPAPPTDAPERYDHPDRIAFTDFADWTQAGALLRPLYDEAARLGPDSPLKAEIARIAAKTSDPKVRAAEALHLVEQNTRYLFIGLGFGGLKPAAADLTWSRRYGDCKGKTVLLLALLRGLGIEASPALVSTQGGDSLAGGLPAIRSFDHVIVQARIGGQTFWLDGTRLFDRGLDDLEPPHFQRALVLDPAGARLAAIDDPPPSLPFVEKVRRIDMTEGPDAPAKVQLTLRFRESYGALMNVGLAGLSATDRDNALRRMLTEDAPWVAADAAASQWDPVGGVLTVNLSGRGKIPWTNDPSYRQFFIPDAQLGGDISLRREPGPDHDAPWTNAWPMFTSSRTLVLLPKNPGGYSLGGGGDVDETVTGLQIHRRVRLDGGAVTMEVTQKSLTREYPFAEAEATMAAMHRLGEKGVWLAGPPASTDPVPNSHTASPAAAMGAEPTDAAGFAARGATRLATRQLDPAIADLDRAIMLDPTKAGPYYNRGLAHLLKEDPAAALTDLDEAVHRAPDDWRALLLRARVKLQVHDEAGAHKDGDAAIMVAAARDKPDAMHLAAETYERAGRYGWVVEVLDRMLAIDLPDKARARALDARCWARGEWNHDLDVALADCEASLKLDPDSLSALDSRALVALRQNRLDAAISDYDRVLSKGARAPASLYGRGLAKLRKGDAAEGRLDIEAATALDTKVKGRFEAMGLTP